jgi:hypothetical protein
MPLLMPAPGGWVWMSGRWNIIPGAVAVAAGGVAAVPPPPGMPALPDEELDGELCVGKPGALGEGKFGGITTVPVPVSVPPGTALSKGKLGEDNFGEGDVWACAADSAGPAIMRANNKVLFMDFSAAD